MAARQPWATTIYTCQNGTVLRFRGNHYDDRVRAYHAPASACPVKAQCTNSQKGQIFTRSFDEPCLDRVRGYHETAAYEKAMRKRSVWVEPLFGEAKQWHGLRQFRLRGLPKVNIIGLLVAAGQNLKRQMFIEIVGKLDVPAGHTVRFSSRDGHAAALGTGPSRLLGRHYATAGAWGEPDAETDDPGVRAR